MEVYGVFEDERNHYIVCEFLDGGSLHGRLKHFDCRFSEKLASTIVQQVLLALNYLHNLNIVHRDLTPKNILFEHTPRGDQTDLNIKIIDFGFACHT